MTSTREDPPSRRRLVGVFIGLPLGLLLLAIGFNRPTVANMRTADLAYLLGTGAYLGAGLAGVVLYLVGRRGGRGVQMDKEGAGWDGSEWVCQEAKKFVDGNGGSWDQAKWSGFSAHIGTRYAIDDSKLGSIVEEKRRDYLLRLPNDLEAIKLLAEWSKWLVTIETTVTTLIGLATASGNIRVAQLPGSYWAFAAIFLFLLSVLSASLLLFSLPGVLQRLPPPQDKDVLTIGTFNGRGIPVSAFSVAQFACFGLGAFCFAMWAVLQVQDSDGKTTRLAGHLDIEVHSQPGGTGLTRGTGAVVPSLDGGQPATRDRADVVPGRSARPSR